MTCASGSRQIGLVAPLNVNNISDVVASPSPSQSRRENWDDCEIRKLIVVWGHSRIQRDLNGVGRNIVVYRRIAESP